jgi:hypothetical protein
VEESITEHTPFSKSVEPLPRTRFTYNKVLQGLLTLDDSIMLVDNIEDFEKGFGTESLKTNTGYFNTIVPFFWKNRSGGFFAVLGLTPPFLSSPQMSKCPKLFLLLQAHFGDKFPEHLILL